MKKWNQLELRPVEDSRAFTAQINGHQTVVMFYERNRMKPANRYYGVTILEEVWKQAQHLAKASDLPLMIGLQIRVAGKLDQGYLLTLKTWKRFKQVGPTDVGLGKAARAAYAEDKECMVGVRFVIAKA